MKAVACLLILGFFGNIQTYNRPDKSKSVTVALETIIEFYKKDRADDLQVIDRIQNFISNVKNLINKHNLKREKTRRSNGGGLTFTKFLVKALDIIKNYDDDDLKNVVRIVDDEARKYHYKGCKFHELLENHDVRRVVANKLNKFKNRSIKDIRNDIKNILQSLGHFTDEEKKFLKYVNSLYRYNDMSKFDELLNNLESYSNKSKRSELNLGKIIKNALRSIVFDHYSDLKPNVRHDFKINVEAFWTDNKMPSRTYDKWTMSIPNVARTLKNVSPKIYTTKNIELQNKNQIIDAFNNYYNKIDLIKTIKKYIGDINKDKSNQETVTALKSKKKQKKYTQTSFELYDIDKKSDFDGTIEKTSLESKKNKNRKKHKRQRKHKSKETKKKKNKSSETVLSSGKSETKSKRHHKRQKNTQSDLDIPFKSQRTVEKNKKQSKLKVTVPIKWRPQWREIAKKHTSMRTLNDKVKTKSFGQESLEGNENFNRQRQIAEVASHEYKYSEAESLNKKQKDSSRKWFKKQMTNSDEGMSIESYEFVKNDSLSRRVNDNDTLDTTNETKSNGSNLKSERKSVKDTINITKEFNENINDVTYDDLDYWTGTTKVEEITTKIKEKTTNKPNITTTNKVKVNTTNNVKLNDTAKEAIVTFLNKTIAFAKPSNISYDIEDKLEEVKEKLAAKTQRVINSYFNQSQVLDGDKKQKARLQMREDISKIFGKTVEVTTAHDVMKFTDPLKELEEMDIL